VTTVSAGASVTYKYEDTTPVILPEAVLKKPRNYAGPARYAVREPSVSASHQEPANGQNQIFRISRTCSRYRPTLSKAVATRARFMILQKVQVRHPLPIYRGFSCRFSKKTGRQQRSLDNRNALPAGSGTLWRVTGKPSVYRPESSGIFGRLSFLWSEVPESAGSSGKLDLIHRAGTAGCFPPYDTYFVICDQLMS